MSDQKVYMPLIIGDWLKGTRGMKAEVRGVYLNLLLYQWDNGFIPSDWEELCLIDPELPKVWDKIKSKFVELEPGKLFNKKNTEVKEFWKKQKTNGEKGGRPKKKNPEETQTLTQQQSQTQTFNNDLDLDNDPELKKQKGVPPPVTPQVTPFPVEQKIEQALSEGLDELYIDKQRPKWTHIDFEAELKGFFEKVRGSPEHYKNHDSGGIRLAFQAQLRGAKKIQQPNGKAFSKNDRTEFNQNELDIIRRHASGSQ